MKIIIDTLGSDFGFERILEGVEASLKEDGTLEFVLVGDEHHVRNWLKGKGLGNRLGDGRIEIVHATDCIRNDETATVVRTRPNSSISRAAYMLRDRDDCGAFVSTGNTGAVLAAATLIVGRIPGVKRPALCPTLPTLKDGVRTMVIDVGANMDCKPEYLVQFAIMGSEYMKSRGVENPRVALVNVGHEDKKGNELTLATFPLLKDEKSINFVGNMEANQVLSGDYDIVVCDGFVGNVLLKTAEGSFRVLMTKIKQSFMSNFKAKIGAMLAKGQLRKLKALSSEAVGGSIFIGTKKPVVKAHGGSNVYALVNAILVARDASRSDLAQRIEVALR